MIQSIKPARLLALVGASLLAMALFVPMAQAQEPAEGYEQFAGCPTPAQSETVSVCVNSEISGGHLQMGSKTVPVENPLTIRGGLNNELEGFQANSEGGLSKVKQKVPGGVIGLTGLTWLLEFFGSDALTLYAVTELAGPPTGFDFSSVTIPVKVRLETPSGILGNSCYIGSDSNPIVLDLTTGTTSPPPPNEPISGVAAEEEFDFEKGILHAKNGTFVDNAFAAPGANGCALKLFGFIPISLNGFVNSQADLPSPAGTNEAVQNYSLEIASRASVYP